ncbi:MAG: hypothetical protein WBQ26_06420 [Gemmatimonadaceae bacterium]
MAYLRFVRRGSFLALAAAVLGALILPGGAARLGAQLPTTVPRVNERLDSLRRLFRVPPAPIRQITVPTFLGAPGSSFGSPSPSGAGSGDYFFGFGYQERTRYTARPDGGFGAGTGFGDPESGIALETAVASFSSVRHGPMTIGGVSVKLHHRDPQHMMLYAVGIENAITWGHVDGGTSAYGLLGHVFPLRSGDDAALGVLSTSLGIGTGRFRSEADVLNHRRSIGIFGGFGLRIVSTVAATADWTGQDLDAGFTITPSPNRGIVGSIGVADLTRHAGNGPRFIMSIGYGFNARRDSRQLSPEDLNAVFRNP